jgi:hypothetical protein
MSRTDKAWGGGLAGVGDATLDREPVSVDGQVASGPYILVRPIANQSYLGIVALTFPFSISGEMPSRFFGARSALTSNNASFP